MLRPMKDLIYVKPVKPKHEGLIELPEDVYETDGSLGEVVAIGPDCEEIAVGDTVIHKRVTGLAFEYEDESLLTMHEPEVLAVLNA